MGGKGFWMETDVGVGGQVEHEPRAQLPIKAAASTENSDNLDDTFRKLSGQLSTICNPPPLFPPGKVSV